MHYFAICKKLKKFYLLVFAKVRKNRLDFEPQFSDKICRMPGNTETVEKLKIKKQKEADKWDLT